MATVKAETLLPFGSYLVRAYSLAVAFTDRVSGFVQQNGEEFCDQCDDLRFGRYFIAQLRTHALSGPRPKEVHDEAARIAGEAGAPELGRQLADDMMAGRMDMLRLADFLEELIDAIPSLLKGDLERYQRTVLFQMMATVWGGTANLVSPGMLQQLQEMTFQMNEWYVRALTAAVQMEFMETDWRQRRARVFADFVEKYREAKVRFREANKQEDLVQVFVNGAILIGMARRYRPLFGLSEADMKGLYQGCEVEPLIDFLTENGWLL